MALNRSSKVTLWLAGGILVAIGLSETPERKQERKQAETLFQAAKQEWEASHAKAPPRTPAQKARDYDSLFRPLLAPCVDMEVKGPEDVDIEPQLGMVLHEQDALAVRDSYDRRFPLSQSTAKVAVFLRDHPTWNRLLVENPNTGELEIVFPQGAFVREKISLLEFLAVSPGLLHYIPLPC